MASALDVRGLSKTFAGTRALVGVDLILEHGEVRGLLGHNGSGKSTLIKILAGYHQPDAGATILANGRAVPIPINAATHRRLGWAFVHQDLGLIDELRVIDNLHLVGLASAQGSRIRWQRDRRWARDLLSRFGVDVSPDATVARLPAAEKAMVAIVRAAEVIRVARRADGEAGNGGLLVLDEPTVYLPEGDVRRLFELVRQVASDGVAVLFVSHRLSEVRILTQRVTVLRDGRVTRDASTHSVTDHELVQAIVGEAVGRQPSRYRGARTPTQIAYATALNGEKVHDVDLRLDRGDIVGLTGLAGSGFEELPYLLFGATTARGGTLRLGSHEIGLTRLKPQRALALGIALIPGDRLAQGAVGEQSVTANLSLTVLGRFFIRMIFRHRREEAAAQTIMNEMDVRPRDPQRLFAHLSGGNQQKALLGKWLQRQPALILLHEPTQGLDVGAREQVLQLLRQLAASGTTIVCASSDFEQLEAICNRVLVFRQGRIVTELQGDGLSERRMAQESYKSIDASA